MGQIFSHTYANNVTVSADPPTSFLENLGMEANSKGSWSAVGSTIGAGLGTLLGVALPSIPLGRGQLPS
jgi:hypothetical protein